MTPPFKWAAAIFAPGLGAVAARADDNRWIGIGYLGYVWSNDEGCIVDYLGLGTIWNFAPDMEAPGTSACGPRPLDQMRIPAMSGLRSDSWRATVPVHAGPVCSGSRTTECRVLSTFTQKPIEYRNSSSQSLKQHVKSLDDTTHRLRSKHIDILQPQE